MENMDYYPYPGQDRKPDDPIGTILKWGAIGLGIAWVVNELFESTEECEEIVETDAVEPDVPEEQPTVMETKGDYNSPDIVTYGDLAREIEKLSKQIEVLNREIERLKGTGRNYNEDFNEDLLKKLAKIVFDQKILRERLERALNAAR